MKRHALIISNPGEIGSQNYCDGVKVDVKNYISYLTSELGGSWYGSEIASLERPTCQEVKNSITQLSRYDYTFIVFCGHGYYSASRDSTILELRKYEELDSIDLRTNTIKRTILLDNCRKIEKDIIAEAAIAAKLAEVRKALHPSDCRKYFDLQVEKCPRGVVVGYACAKDETAGDSATRGGYYSYSLLRAAAAWRETTHINLASSWAHFSIVAAHTAAVSSVKRLSGGTQNPEIEKPRTEPYFPFGIIA